ncbi:MAG TPA: TolC family protein [Agriterribacter sp.]|nr:TolC family protein [Agriterribacter sp.]
MMFTIKNNHSFWGCEQRQQLSTTVPAIRCNPDSYRDAANPRCKNPGGLSTAIRQPLTLVATVRHRRNPLFRMFNKVVLPFLLFACISTAHAQQHEVLNLPEIMEKIDSNNILLKTYRLKAEGYQYSADAATAWMPPMVGLGTYMMPYPFQKLMDGSDKGSVMLRVEQEIPNRKKLLAKKNYMLSQGNIENASRAVTLNDLKAQAKIQYVSWITALEKINIIQQNERVLEMMKKIEEVRYPYNQSQLSSVYRAEAEIQKNRNMLAMPEGDIARAKAWLNALMNRPGNTDFSIDTSFEFRFMAAASYDTANLAAQRKDVFQMNERIRSMQLNIESMKLERKPAFSIQFDHMSPLSSMMPQAFSVMGMLSIPIVPWSKKMYQSEIKSMHSNINAMELEKAAMLQESQGMLYGMQSQIQTMQQRIVAMEEKIIPALQKAFDAGFISYQENKLTLTSVLDNWEALNMMQIDVQDEKQKLYQMIIEYEKELFR